MTAGHHRCRRRDCRQSDPQHPDLPALDREVDCALNAHSHAEWEKELERSDPSRDSLRF